MKILQAALDLRLSVGIFRLQEGFDISSLGSSEVPDGEELNRLFDKFFKNGPIPASFCLFRPFVITMSII